jgi:hypothetical protein
MAGLLAATITSKKLRWSILFCYAVGRLFK